MDWILDFLDRTPAASNRIRSEVFFPVAGSGLDLDFVFTEKNVSVCLVDIFLPGLKQESYCLNGSWYRIRLDLDSKFAKQDWIRTQENQSPNTSTR